jgi:hypothetical protein
MHILHESCEFHLSCVSCGEFSHSFILGELPKIVCDFQIFLPQILTKVVNYSARLRYASDMVQTKVHEKGWGNWLLATHEKCSLKVSE